MKIIINGAGIAGPTLAYWLLKAGHEVALVEESPQLRSGGYVVDFWGTGYDIAEKMGLIPEVKELGYSMHEVRIVDERGQRDGGFPVAALGRLMKGRFTSLRRSDLAAAIYGKIAGKVETIFGDSVAGIADEGGGVRVSFAHAAERKADLVVGADGLHSRVRDLRFGKEEVAEVALGYHVAAFEIEGYRPRDELVYLVHGVPGRQLSRISLRDDKTLFLFVFCDEYLAGESPSNDGERKAALRRIFAKVGWECPRILDAMEGTGDFYFDTVSQIHMGHWTRGRTALVGDAGGCVSLLAGEGTGLAMMEAYVLAGELARAGGDHAAAFRAYEERVMPVVADKQKSARQFAGAFAPRTAFGMFARNQISRLMRIPFLAEKLMGRSLREGIALPEYELEQPVA